ncbi:MAG: hypothetical protein ACRCZF_00585, partial [Gemmataceae bacterium]
MSQRIRRWFLIMLAMLAVTSIIGTTVNAVVRPKQHDYLAIAPRRVVSARNGEVSDNLTPVVFGPTNPLRIEDPYLAIITPFSTFRTSEWMVHSYANSQELQFELLRANGGLGHVAATHAMDALQNLTKPLADGYHLFDFVNTQPVSVSLSTDGQHARVLVLHTFADGKKIPRRYWLCRNTQNWGMPWTVYDFDEPTIGVRFTRLLLNSRADGRVQGVFELIQQFHTMQKALDEHRPGDVAQHLFTYQQHWTTPEKRAWFATWQTQFLMAQKQPLVRI